MTREIDLVLYFCPECRKEEMCGHSNYCNHCGTKIKKIEMIAHMEDDEVTRLILKGQR